MHRESFLIEDKAYVNHFDQATRQNIPTHLLPLEETMQIDSGKRKNLNKCLSDKIIERRIRTGSVRERKCIRNVHKKNTVDEEMQKLVFFGYEGGGNYRAETRYQQTDSKDSVVEMSK